MKEKEIRERINKFVTQKDLYTTTKSDGLPAAFVAYATGFPSGVYLYAAPNQEPVFPMLYAAQMPPEEGKWPEVYQPWTITTTPPNVEEPNKVDKSKIDKSELDELVDAVLELKAQTSEIFKLKALVCAVRDRNK